MKAHKEPVKGCCRCGGSGRYVVGPIINGRGRDLGACYRCNGSGIDPRWRQWLAKTVNLNNSTSAPVEVR